MTKHDNPLFRGSSDKKWAAREAVQKISQDAARKRTDAKVRDISAETRKGK